MKKEKIIVEAGHIYTSEKPGQNHLNDAILGGKIASHIESNFGFEVEKWLLVDNYNPKKNNEIELLDLNGYLFQLRSAGFNVEKCVFEENYVPAAKDIIEILLKNSHAFEQNGNIFFSKKKSLLYEPEKDKYKCGLLDAALYLHKLQDSAFCLTLLDKKYESEHGMAMEILKRLGHNVEDKIVALLYSASGNGAKMPFFKPLVENSLQFLSLSDQLENIAWSFKIK
jgi:hypothetical protein